jgi:hypothetical protein
MSLHVPRHCLGFNLIMRLVLAYLGAEFICNHMQQHAISQAVQTLESRSEKSDTGLRSVREFSEVCVKPKTRKKNKSQALRMQHSVVCYHMFQGISHQTAFLRST